MIGIFISLTFLASFTDIDAWHARISPLARKASIQYFSAQSNGFLYSKDKLNLPRIKALGSLKFKVSESEEETDVDDEVVEFDDMGGSPILKKLSKGNELVLSKISWKTFLFVPVIFLHPEDLLLFVIGYLIYRFI